MRRRMVSQCGSRRRPMFVHVARSHGKAKRTRSQGVFRARSYNASRPSRFNPLPSGSSKNRNALLFVYSVRSFSDVWGAFGSGSIDATFVSVRSKSDSRFFSVRTIEPSYSSEYRLKQSPPLTIHLYRSLNYDRRVKSCNVSCARFGQLLWYNKYSCFFFFLSKQTASYEGRWFFEKASARCAFSHVPRRSIVADRNETGRTDRSIVRSSAVSLIAGGV